MFGAMMSASQAAKKRKITLPAATQQPLTSNPFPALVRMPYASQDAYVSDKDMPEEQEFGIDSKKRSSVVNNFFKAFVDTNTLLIKKTDLVLKMEPECNAKERAVGESLFEKQHLWKDLKGNDPIDLPAMTEALLSSDDFCEALKLEHKSKNPDAVCCNGRFYAAMLAFFVINYRKYNKKKELQIPVFLTGDKDVSVIDTMDIDWLLQRIAKFKQKGQQWLNLAFVHHEADKHLRGGERLFEEEAQVEADVAAKISDAPLGEQSECPFKIRDVDFGNKRDQMLRICSKAVQYTNQLNEFMANVRQNREAAAASAADPPPPLLQPLMPPLPPPC